VYVGRIVAVGNSGNNKLAVMYRISSRSFPDRQSIQIGETIAIVPKEGFEKDIYRNPYITYNCLRITPGHAVVANGIQTDPIIEKLAGGMDARDAIISVLFGLDYEHDQFNTPRIAAVIDLQTRLGTLGTVRKDALLVRSFKIKEGEAYYVATYQQDAPDEQFKDIKFDITTAGEGCDYVLGKGVFESLELPISAACALENGSGFEIAHKNLK
jgi:IMP cyclohydrolase